MANSAEGRDWWPVEVIATGEVGWVAGELLAAAVQDDVGLDTLPATPPGSVELVDARTGRPVRTLGPFAGASQRGTCTADWMEADGAVLYRCYGEASVWCR